MLTCDKCSGRVLLDRTYSEGSHLELVCLMCGKGWILDKEKSATARWLLRLEQAKQNALSVAL